MKRKLLRLSPVTLTLLPFLVYAQVPLGTGQQTQTVGGLAQTIGGILTNAIVPLLFIVGTVMLIWGIISYFVINADNEEKRKSAKDVIIWGIVGLFLASAIGGLVLLLRNTFSQDIDTARQNIPIQLPTFGQ